MFIPSGPEGLLLRRIPIVCFVLIACNILGYVVCTLFGVTGSTKFQDAYTFYREHQQVGFPERLLELARVNGEFAATWSGPIQNFDPDIYPDLEDQQVFDELLAAGFQDMDKTLFYSWGYQPQSPGPLSLVFNSFFYHGALSLLGFLVVFYLTGPYLEDRWGRVFFACFYLGSAILATLLYQLVFPHTWSPWHGPQAPVLAVLGAYMVRFRKYPIKFIYVVPILKTDTLGSVFSLIPVSLLAFAPSFLTWEGGTAYPFQGYSILVVLFLFGLVTAFLLEATGLDKAIYQSPFEKLPEEERYTIRLEQYKTQGRGDLVFQTVAEAWPKYPSNREFTQIYWDQAIRSSKARQALAAGKYLIEDLVKQGQYGQAFFHWQELSRYCVGENVALPTLETLVTGLLSAGDTLDAREILTYTIKHIPQNLSEEALLSFVDNARFVDPRLSIGLLDELLAKPQRSESEKTKLHQARAELIQLYPEAHQPASTKREIELSPEPIPLSVGPGAIPLSHAPTLPLSMDDVFAPTSISILWVWEVKPTRLADEFLAFECSGSSLELPLKSIRALSVAAIRPLGDKASLILDIFLDFPFEARPKHRLLRLFGNQFDPLVFFPNSESRASAFRALIRHLVDRSDAYPLPDRDKLLGSAFPSFGSVEDYEEQVFGLISNRRGAGDQPPFENT